MQESVLPALLIAAAKDWLPAAATRSPSAAARSPSDAEAENLVPNNNFHQRPQATVDDVAVGALEVLES